LTKKRKTLKNTIKKHRPIEKSKQKHARDGKKQDITQIKAARVRVLDESVKYHGTTFIIVIKTNGTNSYHAFCGEAFL